MADWMGQATISQVALSRRIGLATSNIRGQGEFVTGMNGNGIRETWARLEFSNCKLAGYELVSSEPGPQLPRAERGGK